MRWRFWLMEFDYQIVYRPGLINQIPFPLYGWSIQMRQRNMWRWIMRPLALRMSPKTSRQRHLLWHGVGNMRRVASREGLRSRTSTLHHWESHDVQDEESKRTDGIFRRTFLSQQKRVHWMIIPKILLKTWRTSSCLITWGRETTIKSHKIFCRQLLGKKFSSKNSEMISSRVSWRKLQQKSVPTSSMVKRGSSVANIQRMRR